MISWGEKLKVESWDYFWKIFFGARFRMKKHGYNMGTKLREVAVKVNPGRLARKIVRAVFLL